MLSFTWDEGCYLDGKAIFTWYQCASKISTSHIQSRHPTAHWVWIYIRRWKSKKLAWFELVQDASHVQKNRGYGFRKARCTGMILFGTKKLFRSSSGGILQYIGFTKLSVQNCNAHRPQRSKINTLSFYIPEAFEGWRVQAIITS